MEPQPKTEAIRPVGESMNKAVGSLPSGAFNFGLFFNKWMYVVDGASCVGNKWKRPKAWQCAMSDETKTAGNNGADWCDPNMLLDNFDVSIALFNRERQYERGKASQQSNGKYKELKQKVSIPATWDRTVAARLLASRHKSLNDIAASFAAVGYEYIPFEVEMLSPLVIGLGNEHPTEKGFRFDWTLGIPIIPATGIKGVVRLAWLVDRLNEKADEASAREFWCEVTGRWKEEDKMRESILRPEAQNLFGSGEVKERKQGACRGKVIFLDALPATLPRLKAEIMTCHYKNYLNEQPGSKTFRGPTEDQQPNPQKFWAVDDTDDKEKKLRFVFRLLIRRDIAQDEGALQNLLDAVRHALSDHGLGAKTAIGHGRFDAKVANVPEGKTSDPRPTPQPERFVWEKAILGWQAGNTTLSATAAEGRKKAEIRLGTDRTLVSEEIITRLRKGKSVRAKVTVEPIGNAFKIVFVDV